jgi:hypothetical protein
VAPVDQSAGATWGCFRRAIAGARGTAIGTGRQNTSDMLASCPEPDNFTYWTSSQQTADMTSHIDFADNGRQHFDDKDFPRRVRAIRTF